MKDGFLKHIRFADYSGGSFKINCALDKLPSFACKPNKTGDPEPQHIGTTHFVRRAEHHLAYTPQRLTTCRAYCATSCRRVAWRR